MRRQDEKWSVFWCSLLHPALFGEIEGADTQRFLEQLAQEERLFPNGVRKKASVSTLRRKLRQYRQSGFDSLARKRRRDKGRSRAHDQETIDKAIEIKCDQPRRSDRMINTVLKSLRGKTLPKSTLYRHLKNAGATRNKLGVSTQPVRCRWTKDETHAMWVGDFEDGPYVFDEGQVVPTYLSAWIDCHSRFIVEARYYYRQNLDIVIDSLLRAWTAHGKPLGLYADNAKVYHAGALKAACWRLSIAFPHRKPKDPPGGGIIERFFKTAQGQLEAEVRAGDMLTLDQLNRALAAWLAVSYHEEINSDTEQSPRVRYAQGLTVIRHVDLEKTVESFMQRQPRTVHRDFSDVQLSNRYYRVDKRLRGDKVEVRYDPFGPCDTVQIYSLDDEYLGKGNLHDRSTGEPAESPPPGKPKYNVLDLLVREHEAELAQQAKGIDYRQVMQPRIWPFTDFSTSLAQLLGRKGGLTALNAGELEILQKFHTRHTTITRPLLMEACEQAPLKTIRCILIELHKLATRKES